MNKEQALKAMVDKFLGWRVPDNFQPDAFIRFDRERAEQHGYSPTGPHWPVGTNLLSADQARAMFEHCAGEVAATLEAQQAKIDSLMLEFCPAEMTQDQLENWRNHQRLVSPERAAIIEKVFAEHFGEIRAPRTPNPEPR